MRTLSFDLRDSQASPATSPPEAGRGAGVSLAIHGLGISALVVLPLLGATQLPETANALQAPLFRPVLVSLPSPPIVAAHLPRGSRTAPAAQPSVPDFATPNADLALIVTPVTLGPGLATPSDSLPTGEHQANAVGGGCAVGAVCATGPIGGASDGPAGIPRVGGHIREPRLIEGRPPQYPPIAQAAGVSGKVVMEAHVRQDGRVRDVQIVTGHPLFNESALASVRSRRYEPLLLNGVPTDFLITITMAFNLRR